MPTCGEAEIERNGSPLSTARPTVVVCASKISVSSSTTTSRDKYPMIPAPPCHFPSIFSPSHSFFLVPLLQATFFSFLEQTCPIQSSLKKGIHSSNSKYPRRRCRRQPQRRSKINTQCLGATTLCKMLTRSRQPRLWQASAL